MPEIEMLMLANHAEVVNGLLYVHGGGWTHHWRGAAPPGQPRSPSQVAIAATFLLDEAEGAPSQPFAIRIRDEGGDEILRADGIFEVAAAEAASRSERRRLAFAANVAVVFPHEGRYTVSAEAMGSPALTVELWVHEGGPTSGPPAPEPPRTTGGYI